MLIISQGDDAVFVCKRIPGSRRVSIWQAYNRLPSEAYTVGTVIQVKFRSIISLRTTLIPRT